jgi:hypothetical protein
MPFQNSIHRSPRRDLMRVARRFNVEIEVMVHHVPEGRLN